MLEDIGLALGRALRLLAVERMESTGIEGAGSNVDRVESLTEQPIRVGVSMEGRKFWRFVPFVETYEEFRRGFLLGHTLASGLFSEDLDDFVDGLAGGLQASMMIHVAERVEPETGWAQVFSALGEAIGELLSVNESRRSLTPGVKATLASSQVIEPRRSTGLQPVPGDGSPAIASASRCGAALLEDVAELGAVAEAPEPGPEPRAVVAVLGASDVVDAGLPAAWVRALLESFPASAAHGGRDRRPVGGQARVVTTWSRSLVRASDAPGSGPPVSPKRHPSFGSFALNTTSPSAADES